MFAAVYSLAGDRCRRCSTPRSGSTSRAWSTAARSSPGTRRSSPATRSPPRPSSSSSRERGGIDVLRVRARARSTSAASCVCEGTWTNIVEEAERSRPTGHADRTAYAGASGDFNPIHIDDEFARSVGLPGRILHGLWTMAQVARAPDRGGRRPGSAEAASTSSSAAWACRRRRSPSPRPCARSRRRGGDRRRRGRAGRQEDRPRRARPRSRRPLLESEGVLTPRQELLLGKVVDGFAATGPARGLEGARRRPRASTAGPVDDPQRARGARGAGAARAPAHVGRPRARPTPATATSSTALLPADARPARAELRARRSCAARSTRRCA